MSDPKRDRPSREKALELLRKGLTPNTVAERIGASPNTVLKWAARGESGGSQR